MSLKTCDRSITMLTIMAVSGIAISGCGQSAETSTPMIEQVNAPTDEHGEWWCPEHGMPEVICVQCNSRLAAEYQAKGDWCQEHSRPDSQCFICHPELQAKFAAQYEAKYGKQPPKPAAEGENHDHAEHAAEES